MGDIHLLGSNLHVTWLWLTCMVKSKPIVLSIHIFVPIKTLCWNGQWNGQCPVDSGHNVLFILITWNQISERKKLLVEKLSEKILFLFFYRFNQKSITLWIFRNKIWKGFVVEYSVNFVKTQFREWMDGSSCEPSIQRSKY